jgi:anti-sigma-K factor RskA
MASDFGRHHADDNPIDRARIQYLAGEPSSVDPISADRPGAVTDSAPVQLSNADRAELDELRALLADPTLWSEPPAELENSVIALIAAEAASGPPSDAEVEQFPFVRGTAEPAPDRLATPGPDQPATPIDLTAARRSKQDRAGRRRFTRPAILVAVAAAVVAVALSAVVVIRNSTSQPRFDVALAATELVPGASGSAVMLKTDSGWEIQLDASGLPRLDGGQFYQAWLRNADGVLVPIGTFNEGAEVILWSGVPPADFPTMTITRESADGDQASSGQRVLVGTAVPH